MPSAAREIRESKNIRYEIDGEKISDVIKLLWKYMEEMGDNAIDISGEDVEIDLVKIRMETEDELNKRIRQDENYRIWNEDRERRDYERLRRKFEGA